MSSVKSFFQAEQGSTSFPAAAPVETFSLAHFSDPHLSSLAAVSPRDLLCKRLLGYLSWWRKRRRIHRREILDALLRDLRQVAPDHLAITGDLTHIALPDEFRQVARWLERVGPPQEVTVVPGNHDAYVAVPWRDGQARWAPYLAADGTDEGPPFPAIGPPDEIHPAKQCGSSRR
ncbi:MAG: metallophosphoesterase [Desulfuromonadaceae bacterium]